MDGILNIYKEKGYTSHDVVAKLRGILRQKKIGHTGTLDPDAEGVLPVCLGKATKLCDMLTDTDKTYRAVLKLGVETDTQDLSGSVLAEKPVTVTEDQILEAVQSFQGEYSQIPPMYSALKVGGRKLYELAREGKTIERQPRLIRIHEIQVKALCLPYITMTVSCSKGTYIRTLCHDIGQRLSCGGAMKSLVRTKAGAFYIEESLTLKQVEELRDQNRLETQLVPIRHMFAHLPVFRCGEDHEKALQNGNILRPEWGSCPEKPTGQMIVTDAEDKLIGVYLFREDTGCLHPQKMFLT